MECPKCGFAMDPFDEECKRCKRVAQERTPIEQELAQREAEARQRAQAASAPPPQQPPTPQAAEPTPVPQAPSGANAPSTPQPSTGFFQQNPALKWLCIGCGALMLMAMLGLGGVVLTCGGMAHEIDKALTEMDEAIVVDTWEWQQTTYGSWAVVGTATNTSDKDFSYGHITVKFYDANGVLIGETLDNVSGVGAGRSFKFNAVVIDLSTDLSQIATVEFETTAF